MKQANSTILETLTTADLITVFQESEKQKSKNAMFKAMMNYIHQVKTILLFVAATRNADLELHLKAGEQLSKLFFAFDRIKYKRLWPRYIADMYDRRTTITPKPGKSCKQATLQSRRVTFPLYAQGQTTHASI